MQDFSENTVSPIGCAVVVSVLFPGCSERVNAAHFPGVLIITTEYSCACHSAAIANLVIAAGKPKVKLKLR